MVILIMALSASFNVWITNVSLGSFGGILNDNSRCNDFQEALDQEIRAFEHYVRNADQESRDTYRVACVRTERCLWSLPSEYRRIGKERSARTWNIRNAYEGYKVYRDDVAEGNKTGSEFVAGVPPGIYRPSGADNHGRRNRRVSERSSNVF